MTRATDPHDDERARHLVGQVGAKTVLDLIMKAAAAQERGLRGAFLTDDNEMTVVSVGNGRVTYWDRTRRLVSVPLDLAARIAQDVDNEARGGGAHS